MAYFRDSYQKLFLGTKATTANANQVTGFLTVADISTSSLPVVTAAAATTYGIGSWGLFDAKTWKSVTTASLTTGKQPLVLAAASMQSEDKVGPFNGGYTESNKSKDINPKLVNRFVRIDPCTPSQQTVHVGKTKYTNTLSPSRTDCCFEFFCGETYNLRIELKGEPVYRFLQHNAIQLLEYNGGCCSADADAAVVALDSTLAMIVWANQIINNPILKDFISPIVYSEAGVAHYAPGTVGEYTWDNYVSPGHTDGACAGLRLTGSYIDTVFGNCSFEPTDFYNKVPVEIFASMVDFNGDPCAYTGICVVTECDGLAGNGFGETVVRDMILSESYRQNPFPTDQRIREILQGNDILDGIGRSSLYTRYLIQHTIPRPNNPSSSYSEEQYTLQIITNGTVAAFETLMAAWLDNANSFVTLEVTSCTTCTPLAP